MRTKRLLGAATAAALLMTGPLAAIATSQEDPPAVPTGVGTGTVSSTVLGINIGDLLGLDLLDDTGLSTIDPVDGVPTANGLFNPLKLTGALGDKTLGSASTSTTDGEVSDSISTNPAAGDIPLPIASGLLEGALTSVVDENGARSGLLASFGQLDLVGGLLGMGASPDAVSFETNAAPDTAGGVRGLDIPSLEMLNLGNLLAGIGTPLETVPLDQLTGMLTGFGIDSVPVVGAPGGTMNTDEVVATVDGLVATLDVLGGLANADSTDPITPDQCEDADEALGELPLIGGIGGIVPGGIGTTDCASLLTDLPLVGELVTGVTDQLTPILEGSLPVLDDLNLLEAQGINATMQATATDSVDSSVSEVVASIGSLKVANLDVFEDLGLGGGTDLLAVSDQISGLLNTGLGMGGLLDIDVLDITETIAPNGDYTSALSSLTALGVSLDPNSITNVVALQAVPDVLNAGDILGDELPVLGGDMLALDAILEGVTSILTEGLDMQVGTMQSEGSFTTAAALAPGIVPPAAQPVTPPADGTLPRTGADSALPAAMAILLLGAAFGVRRLVRTEKVEI